MPSSCCAIGCTQRVSKVNGIKMFRVPIDPERRKAWVDAIKRVGWQPKAHSRVCSAHFISGYKGVASTFEVVRPGSRCGLLWVCQEVGVVSFCCRLHVLFYF